MDFTFTQTWQRRDVTALLRAMRRQRRNGALRRLLKVLCGGWLAAAGVFGLRSFLVESALWVQEGVTVALLMPSLLLLLFGGYTCLCAVLDRAFFAEGASWRACRQRGEETVWHFGEDSFSLRLRDRSTDLDYTVLRAVSADDERWYLFLDGRGAEMLRRDALTGGSGADFEAFLASRTGFAVETL